MFRSFMQDALDQAREAAEAGEVPVGAVISRRGQIVARARNRMVELGDPTAHAEMLAIRTACDELGSPRLTGCALWVTLEPCAMCAGAIAAARIDRLHFAASDPKSGGVVHGARVLSQPQAHHICEIHEGARADDASALLRAFFAARR
ncbi:nucleoside deaminase [Jannaschia aquimarina]|uniref:tRNA-specific adenosine deaminase n=1 Tax=Jannaschia aquimarina TaxID=935700 RepID=A0A0D1CSH1_9RHOB|nr:nucleoside deaminase [Jannaschia aquimarina]KIT17717.1 tRNA-specific adenosine deaminase [Jannaschia aquimarina]SNS78271.1 tRNA(Arg) A34 adenosine deaminase TadA [Jannaschia aquimarina]